LIAKPVRSDCKKIITELVNCNINNLKSFDKTKDGFYLPMLNNLECFLLACKLRLQDQQYDPRVCMVTIWFKDDADISNYFRQVRKHIRTYLDANGKKDKEVILQYHGQREKHSRKADEHCHIAIVFDTNAIKAHTLRDLLRKPVSYFRKYTQKVKAPFRQSKVKIPKLPYVSYKLTPFETDGADTKITKRNPLATYGIKLGLADAIQHMSYFCKVQQKQHVSKQPLSAKHSLNKYLREHEITLPVPTKQPDSVTKYKEGELKAIRKEEGKIAKLLEQQEEEES
jgi:hypothetical protein